MSPTTLSPSDAPSMAPTRVPTISAAPTVVQTASPTSAKANVFSSPWVIGLVLAGDGVAAIALLGLLAAATCYVYRDSKKICGFSNPLYSFFHRDEQHQRLVGGNDLEEAPGHNFN